jgi:hypothetical protein
MKETDRKKEMLRSSPQSSALFFIWTFWGSTTPFVFLSVSCLFSRRFLYCCEISTHHSMACQTRDAEAVQKLPAARPAATTDTPPPPVARRVNTLPEASPASIEARACLAPCPWRRAEPKNCLGQRCLYGHDTTDGLCSCSLLATDTPQHQTPRYRRAQSRVESCHADALVTCTEAYQESQLVWRRAEQAPPSRQARRGYRSRKKGS